VTVLLTAIPVTVMVARAGNDCMRTPVATPARALGTPLAQVRRDLAQEYATRARHVEVIAQRPDTMELLVLDAAGGHQNAIVRVVRADAGDGWLVATRNTCD
jgi:hypothetical protein